MDDIIKRWKISFLGWNRKIQKVTVIGYIGVCIESRVWIESRLLVDAYGEIDVALVLPKVNKIE